MPSTLHEATPAHWRDADDLARVEALNSACFCIGMDDAALRSAIERIVADGGLVELLQERCPYVFSARPVFVSQAHLRRMAEVVRAAEAVVALPEYRERVLLRAPAIARHDPGARGVFFGYDFHVAGDRLGLIEINTNAGGAMLNAVLARAQRACCAPIEPLVPTAAAVQAFEDRIVAMFREEWRASGRHGRRDHRHRRCRPAAAVPVPGVRVVPRPVRAARARGRDRRPGRLRMARRPALARRAGRRSRVQPTHGLRARGAGERGPARGLSGTRHRAHADPRAHALYADKRNLALLGDAAELRALGAPQAVCDLLAEHIPRTERVTPAAAERLWNERRQLFFKPTAGFAVAPRTAATSSPGAPGPTSWPATTWRSSSCFPASARRSRRGNGRTLKFDLRSLCLFGPRCSGRRPACTRARRPTSARPAAASRRSMALAATAPSDRHPEATASPDAVPAGTSHLRLPFKACSARPSSGRPCRARNAALRPGSRGGAGTAVPWCAMHRASSRRTAHAGRARPPGGTCPARRQRRCASRGRPVPPRADRDSRSPPPRRTGRRRIRRDSAAA